LSPRALDTDDPVLSAPGRLAVVVAVPETGFDPLLGALGIPIVQDPSPASYRLVAAEGRLELRPPGEADRPGLRAHFPPDRAGTRPARSAGPRAHPLVRAFHRHSGPVLDLTAGLGADAYRLAEAGHAVSACERHPAVYALLSTGFSADRLKGKVPGATAARLTASHADGLAHLAGEPRTGLGIYLDPMYPPPRRASALPRRALQILRGLLGESDDIDTLFAAARARAARIVVKRPHHAAPLAPGAAFTVESKLVRFDVYLDPRRAVQAPEATTT